jgi:type II secretory pathway component PulK
MKKGFIALITILTVSAVALVISSTILLKSVTEAQLSRDEEAATKAWATVNACAEVAVFSLASTSNNGVAVWTTGYPTSLQEVTVGTNTCYYVITGGTGTSTARTINASSTVSNFTRKMSVVVATNTPGLSVDSWELVAEF